jgi:hypothetical protein
MKPLCIDLYCGLGGWAEGFLSEGYDVIGFREVFSSMTADKVKCEWCGYVLNFDENSFFTEEGRLLDAGCYLTVFDEHFKERENGEVEKEGH